MLDRSLRGTIAGRIVDAEGNGVPGAESWKQLRDSGQYAVVTPEECLALAERDGHLMLHPLMGGIEPALAWESLRLFEAEVLPHLAPSAA